jgi:hypothetical protein
MKVPVNNSPELAQWYLEKGREREHSWGFTLCVLLLTPIFPPAPLWVIYQLVWGQPQARKMRHTGEAMNEAAGRENYVRPRGYAGTRFMRGWEAPPGSNPRYGRVETYPPVEPIWA